MKRLVWTLGLTLWASFAAVQTAMPSAVGQSIAELVQPTQIARQSPSILDRKVAHFELQDATLANGVSRLSGLSMADLHLGFEEVLRADWADAPVQVEFSMSMEDKTVREILDALCERDSRYAWSVDGSTVNIYPRNDHTEPEFLLNQELRHIEFMNVDDAYSALTPLARILPKEQIGYAGVGGSPDFSKPWSGKFDNLTVRQYVNRIAEHLGTHGGWMLSGAKDQRFFFFYSTSFR